MKKWLEKVNALAKKGSKFTGKLGIVSRAVDALIPDATSEGAKQSKALGDVNTGTTDSGSAAITNTPDKVDQAALIAAYEASKADEAKNRTLSQKWGDMPIWAKGSIIAVGAGLLVWLFKSMFGKKKYSRR